MKETTFAPLENYRLDALDRFIDRTLDVMKENEILRARIAELEKSRGSASAR